MEKKSLRILLMNPWQEFFLGAENFSFAVGQELIKLNHSVDAFCFLKGVMWNKMKETGVNLLEDEIKDNYDLVILWGNPCLPKAPKSAFSLFISNGIIPAAEHPIPGADRYVAVSEEVSNNLETKGYRPIIIRNGIDCQRFRPMKPIRKKLKNVLLLSNKQNPQAKEFLAIEEACREMKLNLMVCGLQFGLGMWEVESLINMSDLVISLGRGVLEAMACEKNVICADYQGNDGFLDDKSYYELRKNNLSGRRYNQPITVENIIRELKKYNPQQGRMNRQLILKYHNIEDTTQNYLDLYRFKNFNI